MRSQETGKVPTRQSSNPLSRCHEPFPPESILPPAGELISSIQNLPLIRKLAMMRYQWRAAFSLRLGSTFGAPVLLASSSASASPLAPSHRLYRRKQSLLHPEMCRPRTRRGCVCRWKCAQPAPCYLYLGLSDICPTPDR